MVRGRLADLLGIKVIAISRESVGSKNKVRERDYLQSLNIIRQQRIAARGKDYARLL